MIEISKISIFRKIFNSLPIIILYEISIYIAKIIQKNRKEQDNENEDA